MMGRVTYEVPLVTQGQNPICWVACMAMVESERSSYCIGIGSYTGGFDPSNSCIPDPAGGASNWELFFRLLDSFSFSSVRIDADVVKVEEMLRDKGPLIFWHQCNGFPYGSGRPALTAGTHAVVLTGIDTNASPAMCWINNPWGDEGRPVLASAIVTAITAWRATGLRQVSYWNG